jgi:hypothetical protein
VRKFQQHFSQGRAIFFSPLKFIHLEMLKMPKIPSQKRASRQIEAKQKKSQKE